MLEQTTQATPEDESFLEGSAVREKAYSKGSLNRWYEILEIVFKLRSREACLDIGTTAFTLLLPRFFKHAHTLDFTDNMKPRCARAGVEFHRGGITSENGSVIVPVPDETYDCILFLEVIEHLHLNPIDIIEALRAKLKPGGTLLLSTPNLMSLGNRISMLRNKKLHHFHYPPFARNEHPQHGHGHDRIYMPAEMNDYFAATGWSHFQIGYHGMAVSDIHPITGVKSFFAKLVQQPLKSIFPSLRQLMLIQARK
jgi:SAM-dependent methyltransferase